MDKSPPDVKTVTELALKLSQKDRRAVLEEIARSSGFTVIVSGPAKFVVLKGKRGSTRFRRLYVHDVSAMTEQVVASVQGSGHWGKDLGALMDTLDTSEWASIDDPVAWLKQQRDDESARLGNWGDDA